MHNSRENFKHGQLPESTQKADEIDVRSSYCQCACNLPYVFIKDIDFLFLTRQDILGIEVYNCCYIVDQNFQFDFHCQDSNSIYSVFYPFQRF